MNNSFESLKEKHCQDSKSSEKSFREGEVKTFQMKDNSKNCLPADLL